MINFWELLKRNYILYWNSIYVRLFLVLGTTIALLLIDHSRSLSYVIVFEGIVQQPGTFEIPFTWLFLILSPILIIGNSIRSLIKEHYPLVNYVPLHTYLGTIFVLVIVTTSCLWLTWFIILSGWQYFLFSLNLLIISDTIILFYSVLQLFVSPTIAELIFLGTLISTIATNHFPLLSQLMYSRYRTTIWVQLVTLLLLLSVTFLFFNKRLYNFDFLYTED